MNQKNNVTKILSICFNFQLLVFVYVQTPIINSVTNHPWHRVDIKQCFFLMNTQINVVKEFLIS